eukprot:790050-Pyramimonas_sp.AAC.1
MDRQSGPDSSPRPGRRGFAIGSQSPVYRSIPGWCSPHPASPPPIVPPSVPWGKTLCGLGSPVGET